jgi:hypothetical protein
LVSTATGNSYPVFKKTLHTHTTDWDILLKILTDLFCYRVLWKSKKDELQDTEDNTEVTCYLAYAIVATIVMVKYIDIAFPVKLCSEILFQPNI